MSEIHTPKSRPNRPCRLCGSPEISQAQARKSNYICNPCHAKQARDWARRTWTRKPKPPKNTATTRIIDAAARYGLPLTTTELADLTGIPLKTCTTRVCELIDIGIFRRTGHRIVYGNGGPSFSFELVSQFEQRKIAKARTAELDALVEVGTALHSKQTTTERHPADWYECGDQLH